MFNHDLELEKRHHPENFEPMSDEELEKENEEEEKAEQHAIKDDARKKLFKEIYGAMISERYIDEIGEREVVEICEGCLKLFKQKYL